MVYLRWQTTIATPPLRQERLIFMTNTFMTNTLKRTSAVVLSLAMLLLFTLGASAASKLNVGVKFWKESSDKESMAKLRHRCRP